MATKSLVSTVSLGIVEGLLECRGTLLPDKKWELIWVQVGHGRLFTYECVMDPKKKKDLSPAALRAQALVSERNLIDITPVIHMTVGALSSKDKAGDKPNTFVFEIASRKWRTLFSAPTPELVATWVGGFQAAIDLARSNTFGTTIHDACLKANSYVPTVLSETIKCISGSLQTVGLFRVPGDAELTESYARQFDELIIPDFTGKEISLPCSVLKSYLRDLRDPIIPCDIYDEFIKFGLGGATVPQQISALKDLIQNKLSDVNRCVLYVLCKFLLSVAANSDTNLMAIPNLALVFGPTVLRGLGDSKGVDVPTKTSHQSADIIKGAKAAMEQASVHKDVFQSMLENFTELFDSTHIETVLKTPMFELENDPTFGLPQMCFDEKDAISKFINTHQRGENTWGCVMYYMVNVDKLKVKEAKILVADLNRIYIFSRGGKVIEHNFHLIEINSIKSESKYHLQITYTPPPPLKQQQVVDIYPCSAGSFDIDNIIAWLHRQWELNFIGLSSAHSVKKFESIIRPPERNEAILSLNIIPEEVQEENCWGLVRAYHSVCDFLGHPVNEELLWDIQSFFYWNKITKLDLGDLIKQDKYPNPDFECLCFALGFNKWFEEVISADLPLGNEGLEKLSTALRFNQKLTSLTITKSDAGKPGMSALFSALTQNSTMVLKKLDLAGNNIDSKSSPTFVQGLKSSLGHLTELNLSNTQLNRKTMQGLVEALSNTTSLLGTLLVLDLSFNKLDQDTSRILGIMLANTKALRKLGLADTGAVFNRLVDGMTDGTMVKTCASLQSINLASNPLKSKQQQDLVQFCTQHLPHLIEMILTHNEITSESLIKLIENKPMLKLLDISDNEFNDESIIQICGVIGLRTVQTLKMSRTMKSGRRHLTAITAIGNMAKSSSITTLHVGGGKNTSLKADAAQLVLNLLKNETLTELDISQNQGGDELANAVGRLLQYNTALNHLYWEGNDVSLQGLKTVKHALIRNKTLQTMMLPIQDLSAIISPSSNLGLTGNQPTDSISSITTICEEIQKLCYQNCILRQAAEAQASPKKDKEENAELAARRAIRMNSMAIQRHDQARVNAVFGLSGASVVDETETLSEDEQTPARPGDAAPLNPSAISEEDSGSDEASTESIPALPQASKDKKEKPEQKTPRTALKSSSRENPASMLKKKGGALPKLSKNQGHSQSTDSFKD